MDLTAFTYRASDGLAVGDAVTVDVKVNAVNDAPVAKDDSYKVDEDTTLNIDAPGVLSNDTDVDNTAAELQAVQVTGPAHGTLTLNDNGSFEYKPEANYNGPDTFTYKANDGTDDSDTATVSITVNAVNDAPVPEDNSYTTPEDTPLNIGAPGLLGNDTDVEQDPLHVADGNVNAADGISPVSGPANGTVELHEDGSFTYTPNTNYHGTDSFDYQVCDNGSPEPQCSVQTATVNVTIDPVNDNPEAANDVNSTDEDTTLNVAAPGVLGNDTDVEDDPLTAVKVSDPAHGTLTLNADGSYTYKPNDNYNGPDSFTYMANDGDLDSNVATVNIIVNAVNDAPVAVDDIKTTPEDTPVEILASDLFQNDSTGPTNESGQTLRISAVSGATNGQAELNGAGNVLFTPATNFNGLASFDYTVCDNGTPEKCHEGTATVLVTVSAVNDAPVAEAQLVTTDEDMAKDITLGASDVENDTLSYTRVSEPAHGTLSGLGANLTYRPDPNYNGPDSFTFKANDGELDSNDATVDITVNAVNDAPEAVDDSYSTDVDTALNVAVPGVLANDKDLDGDSFTAELVSGPSHGQLTLNANGSFTYSPNANYSGPDSFTYRANDGKTASNTATVSITVKPRVDTTAPTVDNVNPSGQAGVSTTTDITVTFSEAMDESTLNDNTVNLVKPGKKPTSIPVTMTTTTDGSGRSVLTLNPFGSAKQNLAANTTYQLTIEGAGDGDNFAVKDLAGIELARDEVSSFTTARK